MTQLTELNRGAPGEAGCEQIAWVPLRSPSLWPLEASHCKAPWICKFSSDTLLGFWQSKPSEFIFHLITLGHPQGTMVVQNSHRNPPWVNLVTGSFPMGWSGAGGARPYPPIFLGSWSVRNSRWPGLYQMPILPPVTLMMEVVPALLKSVNFPCWRVSANLRTREGMGLTDREVSMSQCLGESPGWAAVILWTPCWLRPVIKA